METAARQMELACADKGEHIACLEARKHLAWYLRGVAYSNYYKQQISAIQTMDDVRRVIAGIQRDLS
jgi:tRNA-dihydrouridine synthase B